MSPKPFPLLSLALLSLLAWLSPLPASATIVDASASTFTGDPLSVSLEIDDESDPGNLVITLEVEDGGNIGDLRGFFAHVTDEGLLSGMTVSGSRVTGSQFEANAVTRVGGGNNLNGGGSPCPCDLGIEFGAPGVGKDDYQSVTFTLSHLSESLDASLFDDEQFGVRATSVGDEKSREGSSKLSGVVPEPSTGLLMMLGLTGLASVGGRVRAGAGAGAGRAS